MRGEWKECGAENLAKWLLYSRLQQGTSCTEPHALQQHSAVCEQKAQQAIQGWDREGPQGSPKC